MEIPSDVTAHDEDDELYTEIDTNGYTILHVRSPKGVGSATVTLTNKTPRSHFEVVCPM